MAEVETIMVFPDGRLSCKATSRWSCPVEAIQYAAEKARVPFDEVRAEWVYVAMYEDYLERRERMGPFTVFVLDGGADEFTTGCWCRSGVNEAAPHHTLRFVVRLGKEEY